MTENLHGDTVSPRAWYQATCDKAGFISDDAQTLAIEELESLWQQLVEFKNKRNQFLGRSLLSPEVPRGLYIWGGVGRGKTFLMDGFYYCLPYRRKRRIHFHHFMSEVHHEMKRLSDRPDPLMALADNIAQATRLLCLDELHVDDITDAMILGRLLAALFRRGVVLLVTSNFAPDELYPNGLQRQNFLPAIALLKQELRVLYFEGSRDYRLLQRIRDPVFMLSGRHGIDGAIENKTGHARSFHFNPLTQVGEEANEPLRELYVNDAAHAMESMFRRLSMGVHAESAVVGNITAKLAVRDIAWFDFKVLCGGNHDQSDYLQIAHRYPTVFMSDVPRMTSDNADEAKRFTWLIDVLYDSHVKLVASFVTLPENLYEVHEGESQRIISRLAEMQTQRYLQLPHHTG